jgi:hypothetical protein
VQTFKKRAAEIADHAHNPKGALGEGVEFLQGLDETERQCMLIFFPTSFVLGFATDLSPSVPSCP